MSLFGISEPYLCNVNQLKQTDMTNNERNGNITPQNEKTWNDDNFMHQSFDEEAWRQLSGEFPWSEQLLEKYQDKVDWKAVSVNDNMVWTASMLEKFKHFIDWDQLSRCTHQCILTAEMLERFKEYWNWGELSRNDCFDLDYELIDRYIDRWDWKFLIDRYDERDLFNYEFLERYGAYIPASALRGSNLWCNIVEERKWQLAREITA